MNTQMKPTSERSDAVADTLSRAMTLYPFFGSYFYSEMALIETNDVPTAGTDGDTIWFNPDFMAKLTLDERVFVFCHEVLHAIMMHFLRGKYWHEIGTGPDGKPYSHKTGNIAADYIINSILEASNIGQTPKGALFNREIDGEWTLEDAYKLVANEQQSGNQGGNQGDDQGHGGFDEHYIPEGESKDEGEVKTAVEAAMQTAKLMGDMPAALERAISTIMEPKVAWEEELRRSMEPAEGRDELSWRKPHRRKLALYDVYYPSPTGFQTGGVDIVIDTSGSVSAAELAQFMGELSHIMSQCKPNWIRVIWTDAEVAGVDEPEEPEDLPFLKAQGGGGTDMGAALRWIKDSDREPETIVVLTDGGTSWGKQPENAEVIWGITTKGIKADFGKSIYVEVDGGT